MTFKQAVKKAQRNWAQWQGDILFSDLVGYYLRKRRRRRLKKAAKGGQRIDYKSSRTYTTEAERINGVVRETFKDHRAYGYLGQFDTLFCDTVNYFAEGRNWPQRKRRTKMTKEAYRRIARDSRAECRQNVYSQ